MRGVSLYWFYVYQCPVKPEYIRLVVTLVEKESQVSPMYILL